MRIAIARAGDAPRARAVCDHAYRLPGRGAYLCRDEQRELPAAECLERAIKRGGIASRTALGCLARPQARRIG